MRLAKFVLLLPLLACTVGPTPPAHDDESSADMPGSSSTSEDPAPTSSDPDPTTGQASTGHDDGSTDDTTTGSETTGAEESTGDTSTSGETTSDETTGGPIDPPPKPPLFLCCQNNGVTCAHGPCTPAGYCPIPCDPEIELACGDPSWAVCTTSAGYPFAFCVKSGDPVCPSADGGPAGSDESTGDPTDGTGEGGSGAQV